jgi:hypothetical protein
MKMETFSGENIDFFQRERERERESERERERIGLCRRFSK